MKWVEIASNLPVGGKTQTECPENCGSGEKLSVTHDVKEYWCNCFRCGYTDNYDKGTLSLAQLKEIKELNERAKNANLKVELPKDVTDDIPREGRLWLYRASISPSTIKKYRIQYSEEHRRVILPVFDSSGKLIWYQARAVHPEQEPKYIQPSADRSEIMFAARSRKTSSRAIIVEDILSAIRVGASADAFSLLGTKITTAQASRLMKYDRVTTWLDSDRAGRNGAYKIGKELGLVTEVDNIVTDQDPKMLTNKQIKEILCQ
ncbi:MAG: hypothetical protein Unbinned4336contig1000_21 [Prokaryotic dsDNA virus sp.]|nr:MAG: hypothetical protein Unbinned4336contig1000_21 [Prokaryotic dsDNA virus sp.]